VKLLIYSFRLRDKKFAGAAAYNGSNKEAIQMPLSSLQSLPQIPAFIFLLPFQSNQNLSF
jgi:hypothetical protein